MPTDRLWEDAAPDVYELGRMRPWSVTVGRFQVPMLHRGHIDLVQRVLAEGKPVLVGLRDTIQDEANPYTIADRIAAFQDVFGEAIGAGMLRVVAMPELAELFCGRGWGVKFRRLRLPPAVEAISGTAIRKGKR